MPYADPEKRKAAQARWYAKKYAEDAQFRAEEAARKKQWLETPGGLLSNFAATVRYRRRKKA